jgi:hypothetical protein
MPKKAAAKKTVAAVSKAVPSTKITLPNGAKVGMAVAVTYDKKQILAHNSDAEDEVTFGTFNGVISKMNAHLVSVQFFYEDEPSEVIEIDLDSGMDKKYKVPIAKIEASKIPADELAGKPKSEKQPAKKKGNVSGTGHRPLDDDLEYV